MSRIGWTPHLPAQPKPPLPAGAAADMRKWSDDRRRAWNVLAPVALVLVAADGPVSFRQYRDGSLVRDVGGNRGCWPARLVETDAWKDTASQAWDKAPFGHYRAQWRMWLPSKQERARLTAAVSERLRAMPDEAGYAPAALDNGWQDLGPDLDMALLRDEVRAIAADRLRLPAWDDGEMVAFLDGMVRRARKRRPHGDIEERVLEGEAASLIGAARGRGKG